MILYLVQHGAALPEEVDPERPLSEQGIRDVERLAAFLLQGGVGVERVVHSGKTRALQTAEVLAAAVSPGGAPEQQSGLKPKDSCADFVQQLQDLKGDLVVVSHLPFVARLTAYLVTGREEPGCVVFTPGTLVALEGVEGGGWRIGAMIPPRLLEPGSGSAGGAG